MDGYLNYKVNIISDRFLEVEELTPNHISSYDALISGANNSHADSQAAVSSSIELIDIVVCSLTHGDTG